MKKPDVLRIAALQPRNPFVALARRRVAGAHKGGSRKREAQEKDLVQQLREAGLL